MIYAHQTTTLFTRYRPIFLSFYTSYMSAINNCIAIWTPWCHADTLFCKSEKEQCNTKKYKCLVQYIQPIMTKYSDQAKNKGKNIAHPICFFHVKILLCQIKFSLLALTAPKAPLCKGSCQKSSDFWLRDWQPLRAKSKILPTSPYTGEALMRCVTVWNRYVLFSK